MKHGINVRLLCLLLAACSSTVGPRPPAPAPPDLARHIGDFYAPHDTVFVRERGGRLEAVIDRIPRILRRVAGDTFAFGDTTVVIMHDRARINGTEFSRRTVAAGTFRITPLRPLAELRAAALAATPPPQPDTVQRADLVELATLDPTIRYDIRYATTNNFMGAQFYSAPHAFLQRPAALALARAHHRLAALGYGLMIHDAYRPWHVTKMFWDATPDSLRHFVADPSSGSRHNRGAAVDLTLYDLRTGDVIEMPGGYDEFSERSYPDYPGGTARQRWHRDLLRRVLEEEGFRVYDFEWWHFDYRDWRAYGIGSQTFEQLTARE